MEIRKFGKGPEEGKRYHIGLRRRIPDETTTQISFTEPRFSIKMSTRSEGNGKKKSENDLGENIPAQQTPAEQQFDIGQPPNKPPRNGEIFGSSDDESRSKYDPRKFMVMATSLESFKSQMPPVVTDIVTYDDSQVSSPLFNRMHTTLNTLLTDAPATFLDVIYSDFAHKKEWVVDGSGLMSDIKVSQPMHTLSDTQQKQWENYRYSGNVPREVALSAFQAGVLYRFNELPSTKYADDPIVEDFEAQLRRVPFQLATNFFPDMTNDEAHRLFGRDAELVKKIATEEI